MKSSRIAIGVLVAFVAIQLVPVHRANPPARSTVVAPPEVASVLRRACFDCHSNETAWPLQAYVAPFSWLIAHDVNEGREELNFSDWGPKPEQKTAKTLAKEVESGDMPPLLYVVGHPAAKLTPAEKALLVNWAKGLGAGR